MGEVIDYFKKRPNFTQVAVQLRNILEECAWGGHA